MNDVFWGRVILGVTVIALALIAFWYRECHENMAGKNECIETTHDLCQCENAFRYGADHDCPHLMEKP
jgi:hypothetical protein